MDPAAGQRALPRLLDLAAARGLYVEAVALAGTGEDEARLTRDQMRRHVKAVGAACAAAENCVVALANDHGGYFTTPTQYAAGTYEGTATLYGPNTGPFVVQEAKKVIDQVK